MSAVPAIAAITESIFSASTPVIPNAARSCGVNAGTTTSPAAVANIDFTIAASATISAFVSTAVVGNLSITSFKSDALAAVLISVIPSAPYCDADAAMPLSSMPFAPCNAAICRAETVLAGEDIALVFPTASACVAVNEYGEFASEAVVKLHVPSVLTVTDPMALDPSEIVSVAPGSPVPLRL